MENPNFFAIVPANIRYDKRLKPNAKLLYGEITALTNKDGFCWAGNDYFAQLYEVGKETISRWISQLSDYNYIDVELLKSEGNKRKITIDKKSNTYCQKRQEVLSKKAIPIVKKGNSNIRINNTINNTNNREENALAFLEQNSPQMFELFMMRFRSKFSDKEFSDFTEKFDATVEIEVSQQKLSFVSNQINARLRKFVLNYLDNMAKELKRNPVEISINHPSRKKIA